MPDTDDLTQRFHDLKAAMTPDDALLARVDAAIDATPPGTEAGPPSAPAGPRRRSFGLGVTIGAVAGALLAGALVVGLVVSGAIPVRPKTPPVVSVQPSGQQSQPPVISAVPYAAIWEAISKALAAGNNSYATVYSGSAMGDSSGRAVPAPAQAGGGGGGSVVSTNIQVAGIDEGDIVKTDGSNLYIAKGRSVIVVAASGADTRQVATIDISGLNTGNELVTGPVADMMIEGKTLVVLTHGFDPDFADWSQSSANYVGLAASRLKAAFFDISDPANPRYMSQVAQSGSYLDSRLSNGVLYLVSTFWVNPAAVDQNNPATYVPTVISGGQATVVKPSDITTNDGATETVYTVVTAIDVAAQAVRSEQAVFGNMGTVYMSAQNLYLTSFQWPVMLADGLPRPVPMPGGGSSDGTMTDLVRIALNGGNLSVAAKGSVPGMIIDQFALDEADGYLRIATTWTDPTESNWTQNSALWVLDASLNTVGSIPKLADNETVQSVRFDGPVGYVVTFHLIDPLFTIDLTNPAAPVVQGALKIPGFSQYMQVFGDGRLLGIGVDTDPQTGQSTGLKATMFDVSDPYNVSELSTIVVTGDYTPVAYDHKGAFVDVANGVVGFMGVSWQTSATQQTPTYTYHLVKWTGSQFAELTTIDVSPESMAKWDDGASVRGVRIDQDFYLVTGNAVKVFDTGAYASLADVKLS